MRIFWSWQSDNDEKSGRFFVRDVLGATAKALNATYETEEPERGADVGRIEVDHDTKGVAGSPPIADTILRKIQEAAIFIADVTPVGSTEGGKLLANPNVMIELGYAILALAHERIILIMNQAEHAELNTLPFDLRHLKGPVVYHLRAGANAEERAAARKVLMDQLKERLKPSLKVAEKAMREADRLTNPRPRLRVELVGTEEPLQTTLDQRRRVPSAPTLAQIKADHPHLPVPTNDPPSMRPVIRPAFSGFPKIVAPTSMWTREQTKRYNQRLDTFYLAYGRYLTSLEEHELARRRMTKVKVRLYNDGERPGTNIDVLLKFSDVVTLYEPEKLPRPPTPPSVPALDPEPDNNFILAQLLAPEYPLLRLPNGPKWTFLNTEQRHVRLHADKVKHGFSTESDEFLIVFPKRADIGDLPVEWHLSCDEMPKAAEDVLTVPFRAAD